MAESSDDTIFQHSTSKFRRKEKEKNKNNTRVLVSNDRTSTPSTVFEIAFFFFLHSIYPIKQLKAHLQLYLFQHLIPRVVHPRKEQLVKVVKNDIAAGVLRVVQTVVDGRHLPEVVDKGHIGERQAPLDGFHDTGRDVVPDDGEHFRRCAVQVERELFCSKTFVSLQHLTK